MTILREAAQQALEALETIREADTAGATPKMVVEARKMYEPTITALSTALAQQAEPLNLSDPAVQKRLASQWGYVPAAQAEPVQEPVYKVKVTSRWHDTEPLAPAFSLPDGEHLLYTAPPQRKPLPKHDQHCVDVPGYGLTAVRLVRAVELAHGIKE